MGLTIKDIDVGALSPMMQHYVIPEYCLISPDTGTRK